MARSRTAGNPANAFAAAQPAQQDMQQLMALYNTGRTGDAEALAHRLIKKYPRALILYNVLGAAQAAQGKFREAAATHKRVLKQIPDYPEGHYNLGVALQETGKLRDAAAAYKRALSLKPELVEARNNLGVVQQALGRFEEAAASYRQATKQDPAYADAHNNLGNALRALGQLDQAAASYRQALELEPGFAEAHKNLGSVLLMQEDFEAAAASYRTLISLDPAVADGHNNLGNALMLMGRPDEALASYARAAELKPDFAEAHFNIGVVFQQQHKPDEALAGYRRAIAIDEDYPEAHNNLGVVLQGSGRFGEALESYRRAVKLLPDYAEAHNNMGNAFREQGRLDEALECYERALRIRPDYPDALNALGNTLQELGRVEEAVAAYEKVIATDPRNALAFRHLANAKKYTQAGGDVARMEALYDSDDCPPGDRIHLGFALGKIYEDLKTYEKSFARLEEANRLKRSELTYAFAEVEQELRAPKTIFTAGFIAERMREENASGTPIFIIGMPRSGTTLVEQILASHGDVYGAGELEDFKTVLLDELEGRGLPYPGGMSGLDEAAFDRIADNYLKRLISHGDGSARITDKMPHNFRYAGLIKIVLPAARIVHVRRNPMDTCLSIYSKLFSGNHPYAYDLAELGGYYRLYEELMAHWRTVLPDGMLEVDYEALVANPEPQIRRMLEWCGLPFDPACLEFHKTKRDVRTASFNQVRQPVYGSSVARWRRFEKHLAPLRAALEG